MISLVVICLLTVTYHRFLNLSPPVIILSRWLRWLASSLSPTVYLVVNCSQLVDNGQFYSVSFDLDNKISL